MARRWHASGGGGEGGGGEGGGEGGGDGGRLGGGGDGGGGDGGGEGADTVVVLITGSATLSTVAPTASPRAVALLASACTDTSTLVALLASFIVIVATTLTLAAVTVREITSGATPTLAARPDLKAAWSKLSTVPATTTESCTTC